MTAAPPTSAVHAGGVRAGVLRRVATAVVVVGCGAAAVLDHHAGVAAAFVFILPVLAYGTLLALPLQVLYRSVRLRPTGAAVFLAGVVALVVAMWCVPMQRDDVYDRVARVAAAHTVLSGGDLDDISARPWTTVALCAALVAAVSMVVMCVVSWRIAAASRGRAVNQTVLTSIMATFATLPEPAGGTSVTRPVPPPGRGNR